MDWYIEGYSFSVIETGHLRNISFIVNLSQTKIALSAIYGLTKKLVRRSWFILNHFTHRCLKCFPKYCPNGAQWTVCSRLIDKFTIKIFVADALLNWDTNLILYLHSLARSTNHGWKFYFPCSTKECEICYLLRQEL